jgi:magnesium-transporting ATPase (P-type)
MPKQIYNLSIEKVLARFETQKEGLTNEEVKRRIKEYGKNAVKKKQQWSAFSILFSQFNDALVWILLVAGALALGFGEYRDATIIFLIVSINTLIGFFQEYKAEKTLENIKLLTSDKAIVVRDGEKFEIDANFLVPGDIIILAPGDTVPADSYLAEAYDVYANEFIFTGESKPKKKEAKPIIQEKATLSEMNNMLFMGTSLTRGSAVAIVIGTGMKTELGKIADLVNDVKDESTPLQKQMRVLGRDVSIIAIGIGVLIMIAGRYYNISLYENFLFALALAVSVVPNGLPAAISVSLSLGIKKLLKDNVLAKKLNSIETLASVNIICTDKTGTITRNELMVTNIICGQREFVVDGEGYQSRGKFYENGKEINAKDIFCLGNILQIGVLCNDASLNEKAGVCKIAGDPTEGALLVVAKKYEKNLKVFSNELLKIGENPFSSERMRMSVVFENKEEKSISTFVKGSPDVLIDLCSHIAIGSEIVPFSKKEKDLIKKNYDQMSEKALRVLAFATKDLSNIAKQVKSDVDKLNIESEKDLVWIGMMGMIDPPRKDVHLAVRDCIKSGIKVVMITGDYEITAKAIAQAAGIISTKDAVVINGRMLDKMSDKKLWKIVSEKEVVFARIAPAQKLRIATMLKDNGSVIAMTGDGVNDAPALKKADIGIAMGDIGTDVAKEASDMILLDDNFSSIVKVIKEGRTIYQNLRKIVYFTFAANASEFFTAILGVLLQIPAPITAVQILAIDLGVDVLPSFSLSLEPAEPNVMKRKPFNSKHRIITKHGIWHLIRIGTIIATGAVIGFILSMKRGGWDFGDKIDASSVLYIKSTSVAYAALALGQMVNLLQARSESLSVFTIGFFKNKYAIISIVFSIFLLLAFLYVPFFQYYLKMSPIEGKDWLVAILTALAVFIFEEGWKAEMERKKGSNV